MADQLDRLELKIDMIKTHIAAIDMTLAVQAQQLIEHMRRSNASEDRLEHIEDALVPVKRHIANVEGAFKLIGILSLCLGILTAIVTLISAV